MSAARILVADDHPAFRAGVVAALQDGGFTVCAVAPDGPEALAAAVRERPDACILDVDMPGGGIRAAAAISAVLPGTPILMLTVSEQREDLLAALRAGASGYLLKDASPGELCKAINAALTGDGALAARLVPRLIEEVRAPRRRRADLPAGCAELTDREFDVLDLLREGRSTSEIAYALSISDVTVRRHISETLKKFGVRDRKELLDAVERRSGA